MNKTIDSGIYFELDEQLEVEGDRFPQRKILHTRILKLSIAKSKDSYETIGRELYVSEQFQKSFPFLKRAAIVKPFSTYAQVDLAKLLLKLQKENEAYFCLKKALCLAPSSNYVHREIINIFEEQGKLDSLGSFYQEVANMITDVDAIPSYFFQSAEILNSYKKYPQAFELYQKAVEASPMSANYYYEYAFALYHQGLFEESIVQFENVKRLNPKNSKAYNNIAHIKYCLGKVQEAFEEFEYIVANELESAGTYSNFILVLYHLDKSEEEINKYRDLLQSRLGENGSLLRMMYRDALKITEAILAREDIDEETRKFNTKKMEGLNLLLSFLN